MDMESGEKLLGKKTIFHQILDLNVVEGHIVPSINNILGDAMGYVSAAADTTGAALTTAAYWTLRNEEIHRKLVAELETAFPDPNMRLNYATLERLPYLTAVLKKGLRLSFRVPGRLPRVVPNGGAKSNEYFIPEGYVVSMSAWMMHRDLSIWPNPDKFDPER
ncbi:MAG: hypothetical protein M1834_006224 [Cirrosporium novae-zelandiae]|nr:MAG: hypothetical protein M1834_006224 [Cirrosporium novae-zelandiae]